MNTADWVRHAWAGYHVQVELLGLGALLGMLLYARITKGKRPVKPALIWLGSNLALAFNAEGMWHVATVTMRLPHGFVVLVFAVFEITLMVAQMVASDRYRATTKRYPVGHEKAGQVETPGHPGKMLYVAWTIALLSGVVVMTGSPTGTERILRLGLPVIVMLMWWGTLTAEGQEVRRSKFAHSPRRLAERWGWLVPDEDPDYRRMAGQRRLRALVAHGYRLRAGTPGGWLWEWRLIRVARVVDEDTLRAAEDQVARLAGIKMRFREGRVRADSRPAIDGGSATDTPLAIGDLTQPAIGPATRTVMPVAIAPDSRPATAPTARPTPDPTPDPTGRPTAGSPSTPTGEPSPGSPVRTVPVAEATVKKIAAARRRWPTKTQPEIAAAVKVSPRTVERAWRLAAPEPAAEQHRTNGTPVPDLTTTP